MQGNTLERHDFATLDAVSAGSAIAPDRLLRLSSAAQSRAPTRIVPDGMTDVLGAVRQERPYGLLSAEVRILIAGALAGREDWDGVFCLPGSEQTIWAHVSAREIVSFQGAATPRLAVAFGGGNDLDSDALSDTLARPERLAVQLNSACLTGARAAVTGHLIGAELAAMRPFWLGQQVIIIGGALPYAEALAVQGVVAEKRDQTQAWREGLAALGRAAELA